MLGRLEEGEKPEDIQMSDYLNPTSPIEDLPEEINIDRVEKKVQKCINSLSCVLLLVFFHGLLYVLTNADITNYKF